MKQSSSWEWEQKFKQQGYKSIVGIDEVGRGAWAGPLVAGAYIFYTIPSSIEVFDSKMITAAKRHAIQEELFQLGVFGIGEATSLEIDNLGLQKAQALAYRRAIDRLPIVPDLILLDGRPWHESTIKCEAIIKGDAKVASIAAASILAKCYRDTLMQTLIHKRYPQYGFDKHVGYGTKSHIEAIQRYGVANVHRRSYKPLQRYSIST